MIKQLALATFTMLVASIAMAQSSAAIQLNGKVVIIDASMATQGHYYFVLVIKADGTSTFKQAQNIYQVIPLTNFPNPDPDPTIPLSELAKVVFDAAGAVVGDEDRPGTAASLATLYNFLATQIETGNLSGVDNISKVAKLGADEILKPRKITDNWTAFRSTLSNEIAKRLQSQELQTDKEWSEFFKQVQKGLNSSAGEGTAFNLAKMLELFKLLRQLIKTL